MVRRTPSRVLRARGRALVATVLTIAACDGSPAPEPASPPGQSAVDPRLTGASSAGQQREVVVLLNDRGAPATVAAGESEGARVERLALALDATKDWLFERLASHRVTAIARYRHLPAVHAVVDSDEALAALAADPDVLAVVPNEAYSMLETAPNLALIKQPAAAAAGKLGAGATVAVLDTGTDYKRAPFNCTAAGATGCNVVFAKDFAPDDAALDSQGHGTNVSGVIVGVAPSVKIAALDVFSGDSAWTTDILAAIDWTIQNRAKYNIVAMNLSLGGGSFTATCPKDAMAVALDTARTAGILAAVAAGNEGRSNSLSSPACAPAAVSVGAVYAANLGGVAWPSCTDATTAADKVACFSNSASFLTLLAPGVRITAAGITMSGTSQATPHVAGAIAVLRAAFPSETPSRTVERMTSTGAAVTDARNGLRRPRLDLAAALGAATAPAPAPPAPAPVPPTPGPVGKLTLGAGAKYTRTLAVAAAVPVTSGTPTQVCLSATTACAAWVPWAATVTFTLPAGDGPKTVSAWWKDAKGNVSASPATASIVLDTTAPVGGLVNAVISKGQVAFSWSGITDPGSGVASYKLVFSDAGAVPAGCTGAAAYAGTGTSLVVKPLVARKVYYARLCAIDNAGNTSGGIAGSFTAL